MSVKITQIEGWKLKAEADGFTVISGRSDLESPSAGMSPGKLMAASLGLCTGMHLVSYMQKNNIEHDGFEITINNKSERNPSRCVEYTTSIKINAKLSPETIEGLLEEAGKCYVGNTIKSAPSINIELQSD
ncbi:MAG: OsmC family protein [Candidatus Bathyarchaeota archaeon]|nr:OsmC family protein [Candidatus Bathyarchaeota archaeon]